LSPLYDRGRARKSQRAIGLRTRRRLAQESREARRSLARKAGTHAPHSGSRRRDSATRRGGTNDWRFSPSKWKAGGTVFSALRGDRQPAAFRGTYLSRAIRVKL